MLIEGDIQKADLTVAKAQSCMLEASKIILSGFHLESEAKVVAYPHRYRDEDRGGGFWNTVMGLVGREDCCHAL